MWEITPSIVVSGVHDAKQSKSLAEPMRRSSYGRRTVGPAVSSLFHAAAGKKERMKKKERKKEGEEKKERGKKERGKKERGKKERRSKRGTKPTGLPSSLFLSF